ncbi:MAG: hypothetical protein CL764_06505 [Chloroflexi bacterium]|nr:hypothetical protein [Chloroflexota bacterium]|tara:strand:+ start:1051 stop:1896 length:846 start_codon:yes stop_codon:yes gene_type:complete
MTNNQISGYIDTPIDLESSLCGGQSFTWIMKNELFRGVIRNVIIEFQQKEKGIIWNSYNNDNSIYVNQIIVEYLNLNFDLKKFSERNIKDNVLQNSLKKYYGLRILNQDPWECLVSFICSAASNLNKITKNVQSIMKIGEKIGPEKIDYLFPSPQKILTFGEKKLRNLGLGFRAPYVIDAAIKIIEEKINLKSLEFSSYEDSKKNLMMINGVGEKIADCVLAFSLNFPNAFPVDRWVRRSLINQYGLSEKLNNYELGDWARKRFKDDGSYVQQYLFHSMKN